MEAALVRGGWTMNGGVTPSSDHVHSGLYSYAATTSGLSASATVPYSTTADPVYLNVWVYIPSSYILPSTTCALLTGLSQVPGSYLTTGVRICNKTGTLVLQSTNAVSGTHGLSRDTWHLIELKYSWAQSELVVWLDGTQDISASMALEAKSRIYIGLGAGTGTVYFDDISLSDKRNNGANCGLTLRHPYPGNRTAMRLQTYLWGVNAGDRLTYSLDGVQVASITNPGTFHAPVLRLAPLTAGAHTLDVTLVTGQGSVRTSWTESIVTSGGTPIVGIDENNNLVRGAHKLFPITPWYMGSSDVLTWFSQHYINASGWASEWSAAYSPQQYRKFMEDGLDCRNKGIGVLGPIASRVGGGTSKELAYQLYARDFTDHPCVIGWTAYDEAGYNNVSVDQMSAVLSAIHQNDNNHPVIYDDSTFPGLNLQWYYPTLVADVYSTDNYPLCYSSTYLAHSSTFATWLDMMDREDRANFGLVPNFVVLELYKFAHGPTSRDCAPIAPETIFNQAWLAVIHGRKGISWYDNGSSRSGYGPVCANAGDTLCFPAQPDTHIGRFVRQVEQITPDVLLAAPTDLTVASDRISPGSRVDVTLRVDGTNVWVFAARVTDVLRDPSEASASPLMTTFTLSQPRTISASVLGEDRVVQVIQGAWKDTFRPYEVHVYRLGSLPTAPSGLKVIVR